MRYDLSDKLVIGVASSALFDLTESDEVFRAEGTEAYRRYQQAHLEEPFAPGVAFPFVQRLLSLNDLSADGTPLVEVIVLSRNSPDTGERVLRSIRHHGLPVERAIFTEGLSPYRYMGDLNMSLFLSANAADVAEAIGAGLPAGRVLNSAYRERDDRNLLIAFDFDGVLADDSSERVMRSEGLARFIAHETERAVEPLSPGPLRNFLGAVNTLQRIEEERLASEPGYQVRVRVSIVTARSAPAYERAMASLRSWGVTVNDAFFLGGVDKAAIMRTLHPDIYFDDQIGHVELTALTTPSVHVPFGIANAVPVQRVAPVEPSTEAS